MTNVCPCCGGEIRDEWPRLDLNTNTLALPSGLVRLQPKCAELYKALLDAYPRRLSTQRAIARVWGLTAPEAAYRALAVHLYRLRDQLAASGYDIDTRYDEGYLLLKPGEVPAGMALKRRKKRAAK